jgi:hypothetical protein
MCKNYQVKFIDLMKGGNQLILRIFNEETTDLQQVTDKLAWVGLELTMLVVIATDCTGSCESNYHTITTTTAPTQFIENS